MIRFGGSVLVVRFGAVPLLPFGAGKILTPFHSL